ncbi:unnamed protein product [marine sediment metagenome]|uniref:Uncharacterized protein n=1 Tax=marine sediment metagenome TaxID=412755 RepID=X0X2H1_9ZZZZ
METFTRQLRAMGASDDAIAITAALHGNGIGAAWNVVSIVRDELTERSDR